MNLVKGKFKEQNYKPIKIPLPRTFLLGSNSRCTLRWPLDIFQSLQKGLSNLNTDPPNCQKRTRDREKSL